MKPLTIDAMLKAIEKKICIRKIWRCNAGWGMQFVNDLELNKKFSDMGCVTYSYSPTLLQCVRMEYRCFVLDLERPNQPGWKPPVLNY